MFAGSVFEKMKKRINSELNHFYVVITLIKYQVNPFHPHVPLYISGVDSTEYWNWNKGAIGTNSVEKL